MPSPTDRSAFWQGLREAAPFVLVLAPFGLLFGVVATEAGLNLAEVMGMTVLVIAGASQFAAVQMMADNAPTLVVIATALAVNLRMAMYSAALTPHLGRASLWHRALIAYAMVDQSYALAAQHYARAPNRPLAEKVAYFLGASAMVCPLWYAATWVGATAGAAIPPKFALDYAMPITFMAMIAPMVRTLPQLVAATASVVLALVFAGLPYSLGLVVASVAAMLAGAQAEVLVARRAAAREPG